MTDIWLVWLYSHSELDSVHGSFESARDRRDELIREYGYGIKCAVDRCKLGERVTFEHPALTWIASASWDTEWLKEPRDG